ncbi:MAG: O-antigen ligase family protein [Actinomycetota bacterium]
MRGDFKLPLLLILLHIPLGIILYNAGSLGLLHPLILFVIGMRHAILKDVKLERVAQIGAYLIGVEVLWRMAGTPIFWEFGKYATALIMITALVRRGLWKIPAFPIFYFILLLPACVITFVRNSFSEAESMMSSIMSGPFLLMIGCWFFANLQLNRQQIRKLLLAMIIPLMSVAVTTLFYTVTAAEIEFNGESNFATSGGFGPNQVSSMLGLGAFLCVACFLLFKNSFNYALFFGVLALLFTSQSVLTFSRGGMYNAVGGILLIIIFQMRDFKDGIKRLLPVIGITAVFLLVVFPYLDNFTEGALQDRFEDSDPTKRGDILITDFKIFADNPILGIGVGNAYQERAKYLDYKAMSHTEFGRVFSEHGIFGFVSLVAMLVMVIFNFRKQKSIFGKALVAGLIGWSVMFMLNAGMRLAAPSFIWGMSYLILVNFPVRNPQNLSAEERLIES